MHFNYTTFNRENKTKMHNFNFFCNSCKFANKKISKNLEILKRMLALVSSQSQGAVHLRSGPDRARTLGPIPKKNNKK